MKVLWITNVPLGKYMETVYGSQNISVGLLDGVRRSIIQNDATKPVKLFDEFHFLATMPILAVNIASGYEDMNKIRKYILRSYDGSSSNDSIMRLAVCSILRSICCWGCLSLRKTLLLRI